MHRSTLSLLRCPGCGGALAVAGDDDARPEIEEGRLACAGCGGSWPIERGIPRFVPRANYAKNFGVQWNLFRKTQLDSHTGRPISRDRLLRFTGWREADFKGALILDAGCGAGRFAEVALALGARVIAIDFSNAIDAARENLKDKGEIDFIQADINALPFAPGSFSHVYCLGVIQHTPDPARSFQALAAMVARGGRLVLDVYRASWKNVFFSKYWIRPLTKRISAERSLKIARRIFPPLYGISRLISGIPFAGRYLRYAIPVANYTNIYPLDRRQLREWALLDTYDMWTPAYDQPQTEATLRAWFAEAGFVDAEVFRAGFLVGRGMRPAA
jgi:SAM-dependent methyltransferase